MSAATMNARTAPGRMGLLRGCGIVAGTMAAVLLAPAGAMAASLEAANRAPVRPRPETVAVAADLGARTVTAARGRAVPA